MWLHQHVREQYRSSRLRQFRQLADIAKTKGPTFAFAHIVCPHPPYAFDRAGILPKQRWTKTNAEYERVSYADQLHYVNKLVMQTVDRILADSSTPPIIILQADHGPFTPEQLARGAGKIRIRYPDGKMRPDYRDRVPIFNAYYLPGDGRKALYDKITPVNTFRVVLAKYFGADLKLLDDVSYVPDTWPSHLYTIDNFTKYAPPD